jgi:hypothetical protein
MSLATADCARIAAKPDTTELWKSGRPSGRYRVVARIEDQLQQCREAWMASHPSLAISGTRARAYPKELNREGAERSLAERRQNICSPNGSVVYEVNQ